MFDKMRWRACRQRVVCRGATVVSPFKVHRTYATFDRARSSEPEVTGQPLHPVSQLNTWFIEIHFEYSNNRSVPVIIVGSHRLVRLHFVKLVAWKVINIWNNRGRIILELVTVSYRLVFTRAGGRNLDYFWNISPKSSKFRPTVILRIFHYSAIFND